MWGHAFSFRDRSVPGGLRNANRFDELFDSANEVLGVCQVWLQPNPLKKKNAPGDTDTPSDTDKQHLTHGSL